MSEKFSDFPLVTSPNPSLVKVVGLDELGQNAQFNADEIGGGGGTVQSSSNVGTGEGIALPLSGSNLPFKSLKVSGSALITSDADSVTVEILPNNTTSLGSFGFDSSTTNADPGTGDFRLNTGAFDTVTNIYLSINNDAAVDVSAIVSAWVASDKVYIQKTTLDSSSVIYSLTGVPVLTGGTYFVIPVLWEGNGGGGFFADGDLCTIGYSPANTLVDHSSLTGRDNSGQHIASAISVTASGLLTTQVQTSLQALDSGKAATVHTHTVSQISNIDQDVATLSLPASTTITSYIQPLLASTSNATAQAAIGAASTAQGQPTGGTAGQVLSKIDGTNYNSQWVTPATGGSVTVVTGTAPIAITSNPNLTPNVTISPATGSVAGSMSAADKTKLDAFTVSTFAAGYLDETNIANTFTAMGIDPDIATLTVPASTAVTTQGKELVGASTPVTARRAISAAVERFAYKATPTTPIFMIITGQSNATGSDATGTDFSYNANVWDFEIITPITNPTIPTVVTPSAFSFVHPDPSLAATIYVPVSEPSGSPYVGYRRGGYGNVGMALADRLQKETGRDVYVLSVCWDGAPISRWEAGGAGYCRAVLEAFAPYILANTPALADVSAPDIIVWGQGETNGWLLGTAPLTYKDSWLAVRAAADGLWSDTKLTSWYLMEGSDWIQDTTNYWQGTACVARYTDDNVHMVSATGLPYDPGFPPHFTGTGLNDYGYQRIGDAVFGINPAKSIPSTQIELDANPILGGNLTATGKTITGAALNTATLSSNLVAASYSITGLKSLTTLTSATYTATNDIRLSQSGTFTYNFANALMSPFAQFGGTHIFDQSSNSFFGSGIVYNANAIVTNASAETTSLEYFIGYNAGNIFQANGGAVTQSFQVDFNSKPTYQVLAGGAITCTLFNGFSSDIVISSGATVSSRHGFRTLNATVSGALTNQSGVTVDNLTSGSTGNTHILYGTSTIPAGTFGIYQGNTAVNSLNADLTIRSGGLTLTSGSAVLTSGNLTLTNGSATLTSGNINIAAGNIRFSSTSSTTSAIEGTSTSGGLVGTLTLRPNHANASEAVLLQSLSNAMTMAWVPPTLASGNTWNFANVKTHASNTAFNFAANTIEAPLTSGLIAMFKANGASGTTVASIAWNGMGTFTGLTTAQRTVSGTTDTITTADGLVMYSSTSAVAVTLPSAVTFPGYEVTIKKTGASGTITVTGVSGQTQDGAANSTISTQYHVLRLKSNGTNWMRLQTGLP